MSRCRDGFLEAEYALFERNETLLCSRSATCHEIGYLTSAKNARERLARMGVGIELAIAAANALSPDVRRSYARGRCVCALAAELGEGELFDAPLYQAGAYEGAWLDLRMLAADVRILGASASLKALHLASVLGEVREDETVLMSTTTLMSDHDPADRSWHDVDLARASALPAALAALEPRACNVVTRDDATLRVWLLRNLQRRAATSASPDRRAYLERLASDLLRDGTVERELAIDTARTLLSAGQPEALGFVRSLAGNRGAPRELRRKALDLWLAAPTKTHARPIRTRHERPPPEIVEWLAWPDDADAGESTHHPLDPRSARIYFTRLARELGRDYRHDHGTTLRTDAIAIDSMQRHLRSKFRGWPPDEAGREEVERHAALLAEILARNLGACWVDLGARESNHWSMVLPPSTVVYPFEWIRRFLTVRHHESDLVDRYLAYEASSIRL